MSARLVGGTLFQWFADHAGDQAATSLPSDAADAASFIQQQLHFRETSTFLREKVYGLIAARGATPLPPEARVFYHATA